MNPITEPGAVNEPLVDDQSKEHDGSSLDPRAIEQAGANKSIIRRLLKTLMMFVALIGGGAFGLYKMRPDIPALHTDRIYAHLDSMVARAEEMKGYIVGQYESYFNKHEGEEAPHEEHHITVTSPMAKDVIITQEYVCQIHSRNHTEVCALEDGYLKAIPIKEGQAVKEGELLFEIVPVLYKARWDAEVAERDLAQLEFDFTKNLAAKKGVSEKEVKLYKAKLAKAQAKADLAEAEFKFTMVRAPFDGIVDRLKTQKGSLVKEGDMLTTLSDNKVMWVYFNVTEKRYLEFMAETGQNKLNLDIVLMLANHTKFPHIGKIDIPNQIGAIEANFNNETGNIAFRADFPNPNGLLRHGQTGTVLINRPLKGAVVIPQRATFEILDKRYVYVVGKDDVVHQRAIVVQHEMDDIFVIEKGLDVNDKIVLEGIRQVRDGDKVDYEDHQAEQVAAHLKYHAE
jgi:membrane fusion protein (multidrug efflux system)